MKHKVITALCLVALVVLTVAGVRLSHTAAVKTRVAAARAYARQQKHDLLQKAAVAAETQRINNQCHALLTTYNSLTPAQRLKTTKPECDLAQVQ